MKKLILLLPFLVLLSCSVQKRKYQNGYYVDWNHKKTSSEKISSKKTDEVDQRSLHHKTKKSELPKESPAEIEIKEEDKTSGLADGRHTISRFVKKKFSFLREGEDTCDVIIFKDGSEIRAKVEEIGISEIKYKRCDANAGPMYVARKSDIFMIKYTNGTKEVIKAPEPAVNVSPYVPQTNTYKSNKYKRENHPLALPALIVGILSIISGYLLGFYALFMGTASALLFIPLIIGIIAVVLGITAMRGIKDQPDVYKGKGMAMPGFIMGLVIACIYALVVFFWLMFAI